MRGLSGRVDLRGEGGFAPAESFTFIVVIIGVIAGISLSAYPGIRHGAHDKVAQSVSHRAATAAMVFRADHRSFDGMDAAALHAIEPSLPASSGEAPYDPPNGTYTITVLGGGSDFRIDVRHSQGSTTYRSTDSGNTVPVP
jgi:hypothetical protein